MSVRTMALVWDGYPGGGSDLLALLALADWSDDDGRCWPSIASIARKVRLSEKQARRAVHVLVEGGFVAVTAGKNGGAQSRRYQINLSRLTPPASVTPPADGSPPAGVPYPSHPREATPPAHGSRTIIDTPENHQRARASTPSTSRLDGFPEFWSAYPKKKAKADAQKAWAKLNPGRLLLPEILAALDRQKAGDDWRKDGGRFIPNPATWINGRRWEDETAGTAATGDERADLFAGAI